LSNNNKKQILYFEYLRAQSPDKARQLLMDSMGELDLKQLAALIDLLMTNLSPKDEPFLMQCLGIDQLKPKAILLLKKLKDSEYRHRWIKRASNSVKTNGSTIQIIMPDDMDNHFQPDVSGEHKTDLSAYDGLIFSNTPPDFWEEIFQKSTEDIIPVLETIKLESSDYDDALKAVVTATIDYQNEKWATSLLLHYRESAFISKKIFQQLLYILPDESYNRFAIALIKQENTPMKQLKAQALSFFSRIGKKKKKQTHTGLFDEDSFLTNVLVLGEQSWNGALTRLVFDELMSYWHNEGKWREYSVGIRKIVTNAYWKVDPMFYHDGIVPTDTWSYTDRFLELFFEQWKFRKEMIQAITSSNKLS